MSFRTKVIGAFVCLSLIVSGISLMLVYRSTIRIQMEDLKTSLLMTATLGARLIDGDQHKKVLLERAAINTQEYQAIKKELSRIREANKKIRYVYTIVRDDTSGRLFFAVDSAEIEDLFSYPGDSFESLSEGEVRLAFRSPQVNQTLIQDEWGSYMSGYAPIRDSTGKTVAVLGLDMSGSTIEATKQAAFKNIVAVFFVCVVIAILLGILLALHLVYPINKLVEGTEKIAQGDLTHRVVVKTKDEFGNLAASFNHMSEALKESNQQLRDSFFNSIRSLTRALEAKDPYTKGHSERVMHYGVAIAQELGIDQEEIDVLKYFYIMHDIGKIGIDERILNKPSNLSPDERETINEHSAIGGDILAPISFLNDQLMKIVKSHHERQDGKGYPEGLKEAEIPLSVAILTVADAYDAMVTDRPYRKAYSDEYARQELINNIGTQFREDVVRAFLKVLDREGPYNQKGEL